MTHPALACYRPCPRTADDRIDWPELESRIRGAREARRREFAGALASGLALDETFGRLRAVWHLGSGRFVEPYDHEPAYLAEHVEAREWGFGADVRIVAPED